MASVLDVKKRVGQGRFCTPRDQLASIRSTGLVPSNAMREAAHRMVKTDRAWRLRDSVVVMSTSIGYSASWAMVFTASIAALASAASILMLGS